MTTPDTRPIIHVGLPKTGTSSLRRALFPYHPDILYLGHKGLRIGHRGWSYPELSAIVDAIDHADHESFRSRVIEPARERGLVPVVAWESISTHGNRPLRERRARLLRKLLGPSRIVFVLREPESLLESSYIQQIRSYHFGPENQWGRIPVIPDYAEWLQASLSSNIAEIASLDYAWTIRCYQEVFGKEAVTVLAFEDLTAVPEQFLSRFSEAVGLSAQPVPASVRGMHQNIRLTSEHHRRLERIKTSWWLRLVFRWAPAKQRQRLAGIPFASKAWDAPPLRFETRGPLHHRIAELVAADNRRLSEEFGLNLEKLGYPLEQNSSFTLAEGATPIMGVKYIGPLFDPTGYGSAARANIDALDRAGQPLRVEITKHLPPTALGERGERLNALSRSDLRYDKVIVHTTADLWKRYLRNETNVYRIGYTVWETETLHPIWVKACNHMDEIWVPSRWNVKVFAESGVQVPIKVIPHVVEVPEYPASPLSIKGVNDNDFVFYSIFQWNERKNPAGLLRSYLSAFSGVRDVVLVLKTYLADVSEGRERVAAAVAEVRSEINLMHYPRIALIVADFGPDDIASLHARGDCFVLPHRGEGWCLPLSEAAAAGNPVVTTGYGGPLDFLNDSNAWLLEYSLTPVWGMASSSYLTGDQMWAEPDLCQAIEAMRHIYRNRDQARERGRRARDQITSRFSPQRIGQLMMDRLRDIDAGLANPQTTQAVAGAAKGIKVDNRIAKDPVAPADRADARDRD